METFDKNAMIQALGQGIAQAEGFNRAGTKPARLNNPGDIRAANGTFLSFSTPDAGFQALYQLLNRILYGYSSYDLDWNLRQMVDHYTGDATLGTDANTNYVATLVQYLNDAGIPATPDTTMRDLARGNFGT